MENSSFIERFKNRLSTVNKHGTIAVNPQHLVPKTETPSPLKQSANAVLQRPSKVFQPSSELGQFRTSSQPMQPEAPPQRLRLHLRSAQPCKLAAVYKKQQTSHVFTPYSLKEYQNIARPTYSLLGGLGPSQVGTEDWLAEENKRRRRAEYGNRLFSHSPEARYGAKLRSPRF